MKKWDLHHVFKCEKTSVAAKYTLLGHYSMMLEMNEPPMTCRFVPFMRIRHSEFQTLNRHAVKAQSTISNPLAEGSTCVMQCDMMDFTNVFEIT